MVIELIGVKAALGLKLRKLMNWYWHYQQNTLDHHILSSSLHISTSILLPRALMFQLEWHHFIVENAPIGNKSSRPFIFHYPQFSVNGNMECFVM